MTDQERIEEIKYILKNISRQNIIKLYESPDSLQVALREIKEENKERIRQLLKNTDR